MSLWRRSIAEMCGTLWLVLGGCGSAVLAATFPQLGIGFAGVALAFGLTVLTMAFALGPISGAHFNPAVSVGLWVGGRFPGREVPVYIAAQVVGALVAGAILYVIASGAPSPASTRRPASRATAMASTRRAATRCCRPRSASWC